MATTKQNYVIIAGQSIYGPFHTANAAAQWATNNFSDFSDWRIARLKAA